jgi:hypothetical protein
MHRSRHRLLAPVALAIFATTLAAADSAVYYLKVESDAHIGIAGGPATAVIRVTDANGLPCGLPEATEFEIVSGLPDRVRLQRTVVLAAGASEVSFPLTAVAAGPTDGEAVVTISAASESTGTLRTTITVAGVAGIQENG